MNEEANDVSGRCTKVQEFIEWAPEMYLGGTLLGASKSFMSSNTLKFRLFFNVFRCLHRTFCNIFMF